jgi:hypothetical protein
VDITVIALAVIALVVTTVVGMLAIPALVVIAVAVMTAESKVVVGTACWTNIVSILLLLGIHSLNIPLSISHCSKH